MIALQAAITDFLLARKAEGVAEPTYIWYAGKLRDFLASMGDMPLDAIDANAIRRYLVGLRERNTLYAGQGREHPGKLSPHTVRGHDRMLRMFFNWSINEYGLNPTVNPMTRIKKPATGAHAPKAMDFDDYRRLLSVCADTKMGRRDLAILLFLADTGCRAGGLVGLTDGNLDLDERRAMLREKGDKARYAYFLHITARAIRYWFQVRPPKATTVFCALNSRYYGQQLTVQGLHRIMKRLSVQAGIAGRFNPHSLRHLFAMQNLENGNDIVTVSQLLGHSDLKTTEHYLRFTDRQRAQRHDQFSPLNNL